MKRAGARIVGGLLLATAGGCGRGSPPGSAPSPAGPPATVETVKVAACALETTARLPGELQPHEAVAMYSKVPGFVDWIGVDRGSRVNKGEVLARISAPEIVSQRAEAEAKLQSAQAAKVEAEARLASEEGTSRKIDAAAATPGVVSGNEVETAHRTVEADRARVQALQQAEAAARASLAAVRDVEGYLRIQAPFAGVVTERNVHPGALVGPAAGAGAAPPIVRLEMVSRLRLLVPVPEAYVSSLPDGAVVKFAVPAFPGETFSGTVTRAAHSIDVRTRTMPVEMDVDNADGRLAPGMFPEVQWPVKRDKPGLCLPPSSVARTTERQFVVRIRSERADPVDVTTGLTTGALLEVFGALQEGDDVALRGTDELRAGTPVAPRPAPSPQH